MRFLGYVCVFAVLGGALVSCSDDDMETPGAGDATGGAADAGAPATTGGSSPTTGGRPATTGGAAVSGGEGGADPTTGGATDGGTSSTTGGAGEAGDTSAPGGSGGSGGSGGDEFPSSCGKVLGFSECDPVSGFPCDVAAGDTCDFEVMLGAYACFPGPNDAVFCGGCDPELGQFCGAGTTCNFDYPRCDHYCCDDSDCASGTCLRNPFGLEDDDEAALVGTCTEEAVALCTSGEGGASSGGAGGASNEDAGGSGGAG